MTMAAATGNAEAPAAREAPGEAGPVVRDLAVAGQAGTDRAAGGVAAAVGLRVVPGTPAGTAPGTAGVPVAPGTAHTAGMIAGTAAPAGLAGGVKYDAEMSYHNFLIFWPSSLDPQRLL